MWKPNRAQQVYEATQAINSATEGLQATAREFREQMRTAHVVPDRGDLSPDGLRKAQSAARDRARASASARLEAHRRAIRDARATLEKVAVPAVPDAAGEMRRSKHWERIRPLLEAGRSAARVVDGADDPEALLALRDELPSYVAAQAAARSRDLDFESRMRHEDPNLNALLLRVDRRLSEVAAGHEAEAAKARVVLAAEATPLDTYAQQIEREVAGHQSGLTTSVATYLALADAEGS